MTAEILSAAATLTSSAVDIWFGLEQAADAGWTLVKNNPVRGLSDEYNAEHRWSASRTRAPFADRNGLTYWEGPTPAIALERGKAAIPDAKL